MSTNISTEAIAVSAEHKDALEVSFLTREELGDTVLPYVEASGLRKLWQVAEQEEATQRKVAEDATLVVANTMVVQSRLLWLASHHDSAQVAKTAKAGVNLAGGIRLLGITKTSSAMRPYLHAGDLLFKAGRLFTEEVTEEDRAIRVQAFDAMVNQGQKLSRKANAEKAKAEREELARTKAELEATKVALELAGKDADGKDVPAPAPAPAPTPKDVATGTVKVAPATDAPATDAPAPSVAPETPEGATPATAEHVQLAILQATDTAKVFLAEGGKFTSKELAKIEELLAELSATLTV